MAWDQRSFFTGILSEFADVQSRWGDASKILARNSWYWARYLEVNRECVARWNAKHPEERRARQKIYDARKYAKKKAA